MEDLIQWFLVHGYPFIFAALLASGVGFPVPEDVPLIAAGVMAANGGMAVWPASLACGVFVLMRDCFVFWLGYRYGEGLLENRWAARIVRPKLVHKAQERLRKSQTFVVFTGRFLPGLRGPIFFAAGTSRVKPLLFISVDTFAALISVPVWVWLGYVFADNFDHLINTAKTARVGVLTAAGLFVAYLLYRWWRSRKETAAEEAEPPLPDGPAGDVDGDQGG